MKKNTLISLMTAAALSLSAVSPVFAADFGSNYNKVIFDENIPVRDSGFFSEDTVSLYDTNADKEKIRAEAAAIINSTAFEEVVVKGLKNAEKEIDISALKIPIFGDVNREPTLSVTADSVIINMIYDRFYDIIFSHPEIVYTLSTAGLSTSGYSYNSNNIPDMISTTIKSITTQYLDDLTAADKQDEFNTWCRAIIHKLIKDGMSDYEKALVLHDYLTSSTKYNTVAANTITYEPGSVNSHCRSAYGAIVDKTAVCQGYALAYQHLLNLVGIKSQIAVSEAMNHAWNIVELDGQNYHVDVTFDDPLGIDNNDLGISKHDLFLRSDKAISTKVSEEPEYGVSDSSVHHGWLTYGGDVTCSDTKFDKNAGNSYTTQQNDVYSFRRTYFDMKYLDGYFYYKQTVGGYLSSAKSKFDGSDFEFLWNDFNVYNSIDTSVSYDEAPSPEPTATPTVEPTVEPTATPTIEPTVEPTATPTVEPTVEPTATPTIEPTVEPTATPTVKPTVEPTATPTVEPTIEPTVEPSPEVTKTPFTLNTSAFGASAAVAAHVNDANTPYSKADFTYEISGDNVYIETASSVFDNFSVELNDTAIDFSDLNGLMIDGSAKLHFTFNFDEPLIGEATEYDLVRLYVSGNFDHNSFDNQFADVKVKLISASLTPQDSEPVEYHDDAEKQLSLSLYDVSNEFAVKTQKYVALDQNDGKVYYNCIFIPDEQTIASYPNAKILTTHYTPDGRLYMMFSSSLMVDESNYRYTRFEENIATAIICKAYCMADYSTPLAMPIVCTDAN